VDVFVELLVGLVVVFNALLFILWMDNAKCYEATTSMCSRTACSFAIVSIEKHAAVAECLIRKWGKRGKIVLAHHTSQ